MRYLHQKYANETRNNCTKSKTIKGTTRRPRVLGVQSGLRKRGLYIYLCNCAYLWVVFSFEVKRDSVLRDGVVFSRCCCKWSNLNTTVAPHPKKKPQQQQQNKQTNPKTRHFNHTHHPKKTPTP